MVPPRSRDVRQRAVDMQSQLNSVSQCLGTHLRDTNDLRHLQARASHDAQSIRKRHPRRLGPWVDQRRAVQHDEDAMILQRYVARSASISQRQKEARQLTQR